MTELEPIPGLDERGWQTKTLSTGIHHRVEDGKPFVVLKGRATVEFDDLDSLVFVRRGSMCTLPSNVTTRWTVLEAVEYLDVTEASIVFRQHDDERARGVQDITQAHPARPFRPRRHVS